MNIRPVILGGRHIRLEPLLIAHHAGLCEAGRDPDVWKLATVRMESPDDMMEYIRTALKNQEEGTALPFVIVENSTGTIAGSTRYGNIDRGNRKLEIGWTWIARKWQRTAVNTETKYLLLVHAFEDLRCIRVEFKTDSLNKRSRDALLRIGAKEEGTLRNHMITPDGRYRHTVYYSIIDSEWEKVKRHLEKKLKMTRFRHTP